MKVVGSHGSQLSLFTADSVLVDLVVAVFVLLTVFFGAAWDSASTVTCVQWTMEKPA